MGVMKVIYGAFFHHSSLFYQNIVSLHADVLYFFSDLNKIIELCIYNER